MRRERTGLHGKAFHLPGGTGVGKQAATLLGNLPRLLCCRFRATAGSGEGLHQFRAPALTLFGFALLLFSNVLEFAVGRLGFQQLAVSSSGHLLQPCDGCASGLEIAGAPAQQLLLSAR